MDNNQIEMIEKDKKTLKKLWGFLAFFVLLMIFLLYFRVYLGLGDRVRTITLAVVLVFLIGNILFLIVKVKKRIKDKSEGDRQTSISENVSDKVEDLD